MSIDAVGILSSVKDHAQRLGIFDRVNGHEPKNAPGNGLNAAIWVDALGPVPQKSGLNSTTARLLVNVRITTNMLKEPQDFIEPEMLAAADALVGAYSADFDLDGKVSEVDLLGYAGEPLEAQAGYLEQDGKMHRVYTVRLPLIINDAWSQAQ